MTLPRFRPPRSAKHSGSRRRLERQRTQIGRGLRHELDSALIVTSTAEAVHKTIRPGRTSVWLASQDGSPRLARSVGGKLNGAVEGGPPSAVRDCVQRQRSVWNPLVRNLAVPLLAPRSGVRGVLLLEQTSENVQQHMFAETVASEAALALEAAGLYEQAVAAKDKTEAILAHVGSGVVVTDPSGAIVQSNGAASEIFGTRPDAMLGHHCSEVAALSAGERALDCSAGCPLLKARNRVGLDTGAEVWRNHPDGRRQPLLVSAQAIRDADGSVSEIVHSFRDITRLKQADEAKTMFLATASHELKTPLTVIQGFAQTLMEDPDWSEADRKAALEAMRARAVELNNIVDRILLSSRIDTGQVQVIIAELDIAPIVKERVLALRSATGRELRASIEPDLPATVVDPDALATILDHLLDNAVKYSPAGGRIDVTVTSDDEGVYLRVADRGIGMDMEAAEHCFDRFWQAESSDVRRFGGTGIGLYIVGSLVEAMRGTVHVESAPGEGSTFTVGLRRPGVGSAAPRVGKPTAEHSVIREFMRQIGVPQKDPP